MFITRPDIYMPMQNQFVLYEGVPAIVRFMDRTAYYFRLADFALLGKFIVLDEKKFSGNPHSASSQRYYRTFADIAPMPTKQLQTLAFQFSDELALNKYLLLAYESVRIFTKIGEEIYRIDLFDSPQDTLQVIGSSSIFQLEHVNSWTGYNVRIFVRELTYCLEDENRDYEFNMEALV